MKEADKQGLAGLPPPRQTGWERRTQGFPGGSDGEESACSAGDLGSIPGLGRSPGEGNGSPLQYSCLENPMDSGAWGCKELDMTERLTHVEHFLGAVLCALHAASYLILLLLLLMFPFYTQQNSFRKGKQPGCSHTAGRGRAGREASGTRLMQPFHLQQGGWHGVICQGS